MHGHFHCPAACQSDPYPKSTPVPGTPHIAHYNDDVLCARARTCASARHRGPLPVCALSAVNAHATSSGHRIWIWPARCAELCTRTRQDARVAERRAYLVRPVCHYNYSGILSMSASARTRRGRLITYRNGVQKRRVWHCSAAKV